MDDEVSQTAHTPLKGPRFQPSSAWLGHSPSFQQVELLPQLGFDKVLDVGETHSLISKLKHQPTISESCGP